MLLNRQRQEFAFTTGQITGAAFTQKGARYDAGGKVLLLLSILSLSRNNMWGRCCPFILPAAQEVVEPFPWACFWTLCTMKWKQQKLEQYFSRLHVGQPARWSLEDVCMAFFMYSPPDRTWVNQSACLTCRSLCCWDLRGRCAPLQPAVTHKTLLWVDWQMLVCLEKQSLKFTLHSVLGHFSALCSVLCKKRLVI